MKKVLLSLLAIIVVLGLFAAAGYAGYRFGYTQGVQTKTTANGAPSNPTLRPFGNYNFGFGPNQMPMRRFRAGRGFRRGGVPMMGFAFLPLVAILARTMVLIALVLLVIGFVYWLITRSGWRLTRQPVETRQSSEAPPSTESNSSKPENE
jgi:hypothetical protein